MNAPSPPTPFSEPAAGSVAGDYAPLTDLLPFESFMIREGIPIHRTTGVRDVRDLDVGYWDRLGTYGAYIPVEGASHTLGLAVLRLEPHKSTNPKRHIYEEFFLVIDGHGITEVRTAQHDPPTFFEWHEGSLFTVPRNAWHSLEAVSKAGATILCASNAPRFMNAIDDYDFIFDNPYKFNQFTTALDEYMKPRLDFLSAKTGRAMLRTNIVPDIATMELPLDGQRAPDQRRTELEIVGSQMYMFTNEYPIGRYSRAHYHPSGAILFCLRGEGYSLNWPRWNGIRPFEAGMAETVQRVDYQPGGFVAAAPGGGDWFHQHFGVGTEPLRLLAMSSVSNEELSGVGVPNEKPKALNLPLDEGGNTIPYYDEDPEIRHEFERMLQRDGIQSQMPSQVYTK